jgi:predicted membrane protein
MTDDQLQKVYDDYLDFTVGMINGSNALSVAAIMMTQALSIYKTTMNDEEYNAMVDNISASRDQVKKFTGPSLQ